MYTLLGTFEVKKINTFSVNMISICTLLPKQNRRNKTESQCPATKLQLELRGQYLSLITILDVAVDKIKIDTNTELINIG